MSLMNTGAVMDAILTALSEGATLKEACKAGGVSPAAHYHYLKTDAAYKAGYDLAVTLRTRLIEDTLTRRAIDGQPETKQIFNVLPSGEKILVEEQVTHKFDNALAIRMLSANDDRYNPKIKPAEIAAGGTVAEAINSARKRLQEARSKQDTKDA
jgi:hypothetical protein